MCLFETAWNFLSLQNTLFEYFCSCLLKKICISGRVVFQFCFQCNCLTGGCGKEDMHLPPTFKLQAADLYQLDPDVWGVDKAAQVILQHFFIFSLGLILQPLISFSGIFCSQYVHSFQGKPQSYPLWVVLPLGPQRALLLADKIPSSIHLSKAELFILK